MYLAARDVIAKAGQIRAATESQPSFFTQRSREPPPELFTEEKARPRSDPQPRQPLPSSAPHTQVRHESSKAKMISDDDLYSLAVFLGSAAVVLIVVYHFVEVNATKKVETAASKTAVSGKGSSN